VKSRDLAFKRGDALQKLKDKVRRYGFSHVESIPQSSQLYPKFLKDRLKMRK
jgi:hypothetical protein